MNMGTLTSHAGLIALVTAVLGWFVGRFRGILWIVSAVAAALWGYRMMR